MQHSEFLRAVQLRNRLGRRSCRQHPIHPNTKFGSVHRSYGLTYLEMEFGGAYPHYTPDDNRFRQKVFWWSEGYDWRKENPPELTITGKRLDGAAPSLSTDEHPNAGWTNDSNHPFMVHGIFIPTLGCWKITGHYKGAELSYVIWVSE